MTRAGSPRPVRRLFVAAITLLAIAGLVSLGIWQLQRRVWKLALIEQVDRRLAAAPIAPPGPAAWPAIDRAAAYTRLAARGTYRADRETLVQAVTDLGPGFWVMTPLVTDRGFTLLVNRGFVPAEQRDPASHRPPAGIVTVTGLLRVTEPRGGFLRSNQPQADRWYSRDVAAIATRRGLTGGDTPIAPYFLDADAASSPAWPRGGLTVIRFPNNHLVYAFTWFGMAALLALASGRIAFRRAAP